MDASSRPRLGPRGRGAGGPVAGGLVACVAAALVALAWPGPPRPAAFAVYRLVGDRWTPYRDDVRPSDRTLVLAHGVLEDLESAFPPATAAAIGARGGYAAVLGVSYDWSLRATTLAPRYAALLRRLPARRLDVEGHSYGGLVSVAAIAAAGIAPRDVVLLGAPLAGTPFARPTPLTRLTLRLPAAWWRGNVGAFRRMRDDGASADLAPGSDLQRRLAATLARLVASGRTHVVLAAGSGRFGFARAADLYLRAFGLARPDGFTPSDGLIPIASALSRAGLPAAGGVDAGVVDAGVFPVRHADLRSDPAVMDYVATHLRRDDGRAAPASTAGAQASGRRFAKTAGGK